MADTALIGRNHELERCRAALGDAERSSAGGLVFQGAPGIGKTTLLDAVADVAAQRGFRVLRVACDEPDAQRPFNVFVELLGLDRVTTDGRLDHLARLILEASPATTDNPTQSPDLRVRIVDELSGVIEALTLDSPIALLLDDLQWSDPPSLLALTQLLHDNADRRVLFVGAHRPSVAAELARLPGERIALSGLDVGDVRTLVAGLSDAPPDDSLLEVTRRAGGNPLFVTELVQALRQEGRIDVVDGTARATGGEVPQSVHATVRRRMSSMPRDTLSTLTVAAVLGEPFSLEDLAIITGNDGVAVYDTLTPAVAADFLHAVDERFDFRHDVVREALYLELPVPARRAFHLKVARALAAHGAAPSRVARHFAMGAEIGDVEAAEWLHRAGVALTPYSPSTALDLLQQALVLIGRAAPDRVGILADLLTAAFQAGELVRCERAANDLLAEATDERSRMSAYSALFGARVVQERPADALAVAEVVLALDGLGDGDRALWLALQAGVFAGTGDMAQAVKVAEEALRLGRASGVAYATGRALTVQAAALKTLGELERAADLADASLQEYVPSATASFRNQTATHDLLQAFVFNSPMLIDADRFEEAEDALRSATVGLADLGQVPMLVLAHRALVVLLFHAGRWDEALAEFETARAASEHAVAARPIFGDPLPELLVRMDRLNEAGTAAAAALASVDLSLPLPGASWIAAGSARLSDAIGDVPAARARLAGMHDVAVAFGVSPEIRAVSLPLVRSTLDEGRQDEARRLAEQGDRAAERAGDVPSTRATAVLMRALVEGDDNLFVSAIETFRRSPRMVALADALEDAGTRSLDAEPAVRVERLEEARTLFESFGAVRDARRVGATLRSLGVRSGSRGTRGRPTSGWESLTPSEIRVVELLSEGLTNPQIGERLYLSRKTVATHVSSALRKLGVSTRTEIAAIVARRSS